MKTILVVDDDYVISNLIGEILSQKYKVISAQNGKEAINIFKLFKENNSEIDLVITDLIMPNLTGLDVVENICNLSQKVKIIVFSGVISQIEGFAIKKNPRINKFLSKPVDISNIETAVLEVLDRQPLIFN